MHGMVLDALLAVAAAALGVRNLDGNLALLPVLLVAAGSLVFRDRWPVAVFGWVLACSAGIALWSLPAVPGVALLIALYTVAATRSRAVALVAAGVLEVAVVVAAVRLPGSWAQPAAFLTALLVAVLGLGLATASRRAYVAGLHDRALALERERDQQAELAAAAERARIAREMHDIVAHHLTVMVALSDGAAAAGTERAGEAMRAVAATGRRALAETRRLVGVLRTDPPAGRAPTAPHGDRGDGVGGGGGPDHPAGVAGYRPAPGVAALPDLVGEVRAAGLPTTLDVTGAAAGLPDGVQLAAYRVVQEALTNSLKHAGAGARAAVRLDAGPDEVRIDVRDVPAGLVGMRERAQAYGGELAAGPDPDGGWAIAATLRVDA
jgi:signal transduction histidine kinase